MLIDIDSKLLIDNYKASICRKRILVLPKKLHTSLQHPEDRICKTGIEIQEVICSSNSKSKRFIMYDFI